MHYRISAYIGVFMNGWGKPDRSIDNLCYFYILCKECIDYILIILIDIRYRSLPFGDIRSMIDDDIHYSFTAPT